MQQCPSPLAAMNVAAERDQVSFSTLFWKYELGNIRKQMKVRRHDRAQKSEACARNLPRREIAAQSDTRWRWRVRLGKYDMYGSYLIDTRDGGAMGRRSPNRATKQPATPGPVAEHSSAGKHIGTTSRNCSCSNSSCSGSCEQQNRTDVTKSVGYGTVTWRYQIQSQIQWAIRVSCGILHDKPCRIPTLGRW